MNQANPATQQILRGHIYFVSLDPAFGYELAGAKMRPVLVISVNDLQKQAHMVTVIPATSEKGRHRSLTPNQVRVNRADMRVFDGRFGLDENKREVTTIFECHQIRAISEGRFTQGSVAQVMDPVLFRIEDSIRYCLGMAPEA